MTSERTEIQVREESSIQVRKKGRPNVLQAKAAAIVFGLNPPNKLQRDVLTRKMLRKLAKAGIHDVHPWWRCKKQETPCPMHNPSGHHMRTWPWLVRHDKEHLTERVCKHGVGHPDPDSLAWAASKGKDVAWLSRHGCECKCCSVQKFVLCVCCEVIPATGIYLCDGCSEHVSDEYAKGYALGGCRVYDAWCRCEPYPWEVAA